MFSFPSYAALTQQLFENNKFFAIILPSSYSSSETCTISHQNTYGTIFAFLGWIQGDSFPHLSGVYDCIKLWCLQWLFGVSYNLYLLIWFYPEQLWHIWLNILSFLRIQLILKNILNVCASMKVGLSCLNLNGMTLCLLGISVLSVFPQNWSKAYHWSTIHSKHSCHQRVSLVVLT